ncbi:UDP-N-acetylmuramate dehydrogenase [Pantoea sp. 1.19]|uniref:UDP-N-acetylmuramate dehydrogenase n=1 Tax=Pantoea sp. 1.19 TaxID=1925589 RepID=UPI000948C0B3|nr:UDP-N-acetylmuramate dehydrogenase [Pantoea sp. 1.19]
MSCPHTSLKTWNTFQLDARAKNIRIVHDAATLCDCWQQSRAVNEPVLLLGEGSNVLFLKDFNGQVLINRISGIAVTETAGAWLLHVGAGENWHRLVDYTLDQGYPGLENLALIPGCVGSAPIQNIGAYGVELKKVCEYVDIVHLPSGREQRLTVDECQFGYRDSVFKHQYRDEFAIIAVGLRLAKQWQPVLSYGDLARLDPATVTPRMVYDAVCHMRRCKLPDPAVTGNAGSFFKNPVIAADAAASLLARFPHMPHYPQADGQVKLAAGWLIDQCGLKGLQRGGAMVHHQQALVLVNAGQASGGDVVALAHAVRQHVGTQFDIWLEPEVRFIDADGETDAIRAIA